jgi:hypothetical protein
MNRVLFAATILVTALAIDPIEHIPVASAQPAAALGRMLPDGSMDPGTVSVRVVAGSPSSPVIGTEVTLVVGGTPRVARTDNSGRALFPGLTAGTQVQAKIVDAEGKDQTSEAFEVPSAGGARVMLSTKPFVGGAGPMMGGGAAAAPGGMPEARQMSGQPRPDREQPAGSYSVRLTYNNLAMIGGKPTDSAPPVGETVTLVAYNADDKVTVKTEKTDAAGHATFFNLDPSGSTVYFALAALPRGAGVDRVMAMPIQLDGQMGVKAILSGDKRDATTPNLDELATQQAIPTPAGKVRVTIEGFPSDGAPVRLVDAANGSVIAQGTPVPTPPDPSAVEGGTKFEARSNLAAGTVEVQVHGGPGQTNEAIPNVEVRFVPAATPEGKVPEGVVATTAADGWFSTTVPTTGLQKAIFKVNGRDMVSEPFDVSKTGGALDIAAHWASEGRPQVLLDLPAELAGKPGAVLYAETTLVSGKLAGTYRSMPFAPIAQTGTHVGVVVYPRLLVKFSLRAMIEDQLLAVQGRWVIENNSWSPYRATMDGMIVPLPKGFKGGIVADTNQNDVAVVPGEGLRVLRPIPPGSKTFVAGFSLPVDGGDVDWALDLPLGTFQSDLHIRNTPGMQVELPKNAHGTTKEGKDGLSYFMVEDITIPKGQSMVLSISGLPSQPAWKLWVPRLIGVLVIATILTGLGFTAFRKRSVVIPDNAARRAALLDELVELERSGKDARRKEQVMSELEKLWGS